MKKPKDEVPHLLSEDEIGRLALSILSFRHPKGATEEEIHKVVQWAENIRIDSGMLDAVLDGVLLVDFQDGLPVFVLSNKGKQEAEMLPTTQK